MRVIVPILLCLFLSTSALGQTDGMDLRIPLVEEALRFLRKQALADISDSLYLRAGAMRVCGPKIDGSGCRPSGVPIPSPEDRGPSATRAWRSIIESNMSALMIKQKDAFDRVAFQRYVVDGMVEALADPASFFLVPTVYRKINSIPSSFIGFGIRVIPQVDDLVIGAVYSGSPAEAAGLKAGDRIVEVSDQPVTGYYRPLALAAIWGADGETLRLCLRGSDGRSRDVVLHYKPWTFESYRIERRGEILVAEIRHFKRGLVAELRQQMAPSIKGLVIDLSQAASGDEDEVIGLANLLLSTGSIGSKSTRIDLGNRKWEASSSTDGEQPELATALVVDRGTAGLAELLAAALRKPARAILIGRQTAGYDTLETLRPLQDGSALQVTSTRLWGPDKLSLSEGVQPHLKTDRVGLLDLALSILNQTTGPTMEQLLEAARKVVN